MNRGISDTVTGDRERNSAILALRLCEIGKEMDLGP